MPEKKGCPLALYFTKFPNPGEVPDTKLPESVPERAGLTVAGANGMEIVVVPEEMTLLVDPARISCWRSPIIVLSAPWEKVSCAGAIEGPKRYKQPKMDRKTNALGVLATNLRLKIFTGFAIMNQG